MVYRSVDRGLQVCRPWFRVSKGKFSVEHLAQKNLMAVTIGGRQLA